VGQQDSKGLARALKDEATSLTCAGRCEQAADAYRRLSELEPTEGLHHVRRGHLLLRLGLREQGLQAFRQAAELFRKAGEPRRGTAACQLILESCPNDPEALRIQSELRTRRRFGLNPNDYAPPRSREPESTTGPDPGFQIQLQEFELTLDETDTVNSIKLSPTDGFVPRPGRGR
jgi:tetratricopeptide (TPR) repeat protein